MVASFTQLLAVRYRDKLDKDAREFIGFAVDGARRMQELIKDLLDYSRVDHRVTPPEPVAAWEVAQQALSNLQVAVVESGAFVRVEPLPTVVGRKTQLVQLLQNLLSNALKFRGPEPPVVQVSARREGSAWIFSVEDNGIGVEPRHREIIFTLFQRLHPREKYPGTGVGLATCKKIVERHGGRIWVESGPGKGSRFFFTLPAEAAHESR